MPIVGPLQKNIQKVGIIAKSTIHERADVLRRIIKFLKDSKKEVIMDTHCAPLIKGATGTANNEIFNQSDLVVVLGGDGTIIKSAGCAGKKITPVLGINLGTLGFNTEITHEMAEATLTQIFKKKYFLDRRTLLRVTHYRAKKKINTFLALNDGVINQGLFARLIELNIEIDERKVASFKADGMIIATPTGSTAHSLSAGGPIVHPTLSALILTPICPSTLALRPIVIPNDRQVIITVETRRRGSHNIGLTIDGQHTVPLEYGDKIKARKSSRQFYMVRIQTRNYYRLLREKLGWGIHTRE